MISKKFKINHKHQGMMYTIGSFQLSSEKEIGCFGTSNTYRWYYIDSFFHGWSSNNFQTSTYQELIIELKAKSII